MNGATSFEFVRVHPGGLLLNLTSGSLFRLNESAAFIWEAWLRGATAQQVASDLERSYNLPRQPLQNTSRPPSEDRSRGGTPGPPSGEFLYQTHGGGICLLPRRDTFPGGRPPGRKTASGTSRLA